MGPLLDLRHSYQARILIFFPPFSRGVVSGAFATDERPRLHTQGLAVTVNLNKFSLQELNLMGFPTKALAQSHARAIGKGIPFEAANRFCRFWILLASCAESLPGARMVQMLQKDGKWMTRAHPGFMSGNLRIMAE